MLHSGEQSDFKMSFSKFIPPKISLTSSKKAFGKKHNNRKSSSGRKKIEIQHIGRRTQIKHNRYVTKS
jgi:hypothetical protein